MNTPAPAFVLANVTPKKAMKPPRILIYGTPKIGKTTFAASIPNNIILDVEGGSGMYNVARVNRDELLTFAQVKEVLSQLENSPHNYGVLTIDTVDWLEKVIFTHAAAINGKASVADVPYGAGYATAQTLWAEILDTLDRICIKRGLMILLIAHEQLRQIHDPQVGVYDKFTMKLQDKDKGSSSASIVKEWVDAILFIDTEVFVKSEKVGVNQKVNRASGGQRIIYTMESPAFLAGNRFGLPPTLPFDWPSLVTALGAAMSK